MKIKLICIGKNMNTVIENGVKQYSKRIENYCQFEIVYLKTPSRYKSSNVTEIQKNEGAMIQKIIENNDFIILLDEKGSQYSSKEFAHFLEKKMIGNIKSMVFVIGGAYGFSESISDLGKHCLSLSKMTFSHQIVRVIFLEQLYRAFTILKNEPYHNE